MKHIVKRLVIRSLNVRVKRLLNTKRPIIITVTGSIGKTTTKIAIAEVLEAKLNVGFDRDSYNTDIGLPLALFDEKVPARLWDGLAWGNIFRRIDKMVKNYPYEAVVLEVADDEQAMMQPYVDMLKPDICVVTGAAPVHMAHMDTMEKVVGDLAMLASPADKIIYNATFPELTSTIGVLKRAKGYGAEKADIRFIGLERRDDGLLSGYLGIGDDRYPVDLPFVARTGLQGALAAVTVARTLNIHPADIARGLSQLTSVPGRMNRLVGRDGVMIIDDSYNSSPKAVIAAIDTLNELRGRHIAVLGSMNELGDEAEKLHREVGVYISDKVDILVTIGENSKKFLARAAKEAGLPIAQVHSFATPYEAAKFLDKTVQSGDIVLAKGSQDKVYAEEALKEILADEVDPIKVLVRQSAVWKSRKRASFLEDRS